MPGQLFVVATPIGNLEDVSHRAVRILGEVDLIACEDTRHTRRLLERFDIQRPLISYHEHNESRRAAELVEELRAGRSVALVTDAGTPVVSDPGFEVVRLAVVAGIPVVPVPGPSAVMAALSASGLPSDSFLFLGFLPAKGQRRAELLDQIAALDMTAILYEAPHRILATLDDLVRVAGDRPLVAAREITKLHEEFLRGTPAAVRVELAARPAIKGEFTLVLGKPAPVNSEPLDSGSIRAEVAERVRAGVPRMQAIKGVARARKLPKRAVYDIVEQDG